MGFMCDFCGKQRSVIYCRSDAASLCLSCDRNVHSANALSRRHSRTLVCERCNKQPALVRCIEERISLCPSCDWQTHSSTSAVSTHKRQAVRCYIGCPSAAELSTMWSFLLDFQSVGDSTCEQGMGSMSIADNRPKDNQNTEGENNIQGDSDATEADGMQKMNKSTIGMGSSVPPNVEHATGSTSTPSPKPSSLFNQIHSVTSELKCIPVAVSMSPGYNFSSNLNEQRESFHTFVPTRKPKSHPYVLLNSSLGNWRRSTPYKTPIKRQLSGTKGTFLYDGADGFYDNFNIDEGDLSMENYEDLFDSALNNPGELFADADIDDFFAMKDMSGVNANCQSAHLLEEPPTAPISILQRSDSNAESAESMMSCKTEPPNLGFPTQAHSNLSFSGLAGESTAGDYQDCGASPMLLMGEPPWFPPGPESPHPSTSNRNDAVMRYREKKKIRKFDKQVRYASRKARADVRRRVKGRFVKAGDRYDYDPMNQTRSC